VLAHLRELVQVILGGDSLRLRRVEQEVVRDPVNIRPGLLCKTKVDENTFWVDAILEYELFITTTPQTSSDMLLT